MRRITCVAAVVAALSLVACGGGGGSDSPATGSGQPTTGFRDEPTNVPLANVAPWPVKRAHYGIWALPNLSAADALHMPVYHDHDGDGRRLFVGIDQGQDRGSRLGVIGARGSTEIRYGKRNDGAGRGAVAGFLDQASAGGVWRFSTPPEVRIIGAASPDEIDWVIRTVQLLNASLPESARLRVGARLPGFSLYDNVGYDGHYQVSGAELRNTIHVEFVSARQFRHDAFTAGIAHYLPDGAYIQFNRDGQAIGDTLQFGVENEHDRSAVVTLAHEFMHALGVRDHPRILPGFVHIMPTFNGGHYTETHGERQPHSILYPLDREALRALYSRLDIGDDPADLGPWSSSSTHLAGYGQHADFGVALRNGYAEPWAYGYEPDTTLANNRSLAGSATWTGALLGFSGRSPVAGDAEIGVTLATMTGRADFTSLETWAAGAAPGAEGSGTTWLDGDLGYTIAVRGNTFRETGGDDGRLTGIFTGAGHEGAAGTLERSDLTAAFGASR